MTNERAAEILNPTHYEDYDSLETVQEACRMGMVALKMQIPEVPLAPGAIFDFTCPHCGSRDYLKNEDGNRNKFCGQCGKAEEAFSNFVEELADIYLCSIVLFGGELDDDDPCNMCDAVGDRMVEIMEQKLARWKYRLMKKEAPNVPEE